MDWTYFICGVAMLYFGIEDVRIFRRTNSSFRLTLGITTFVLAAFDFYSAARA